LQVHVHGKDGFILANSCIATIEDEHSEGVENEHEQERIEYTYASKLFTCLNRVIDEIEESFDKDDYVCCE
jgi:hypothetical protein